MNKVSLATLSKIEHQQLLKCGVPRNIFSFKPYILDNAITAFTSEVEGIKPKRISTNTQHEYLDKILANPFHNAYLMCICSKPNDNLAKMLAAVVMNKAIKHYLQAIRTENSSRSKLLRQRTLPIWHNVTGSFQDELRDRKELRPSMIVLSNITKDSSTIKREKIRDLLEIYSSIPRILVVAGGDPVTFFNEQLMYSLNYALLVCKPNILKAHQI